MAQIVSDWTFYCSPLWKISIQQPITVFAMRCFIFNWTFRNLELKKRTLAFLQCPATATNGSIFHTEIWVEWLLHYLYQPWFNTPKLLILEDPGGKIWKPPKISIKRSLFGMLTLPSQPLADSSFVTTRYDSQSWIKKTSPKAFLNFYQPKLLICLWPSSMQPTFKTCHWFANKNQIVVWSSQPPTAGLYAIYLPGEENIGQHRTMGKNATFTSERMGEMGRNENLEITWMIPPWMSRTKNPARSDRWVWRSALKRRSRAAGQLGLAFFRAILLFCRCQAAEQAKAVPGWFE